MATPQPAPRTWTRRLLALLGTSIVLVWAAPIIAGYTPLVGWACKQADGYIDGSVTVGSASLGWFSPIVLNDVAVRDADGNVVAEMPRVEGNRSLLRLLLDRGDLGSFRIERAKIDCVFRGNESNLERLFAKIPKEPANAQRETPATTLPKVDLDVIDAMVRIDDADTKQHWQIRAVSINAQCFREDAKAIQLNIQGALHDGTEPGSLKVEASVQNFAESNLAITAKGKFAAFPLSLTNVIARRYQAGIDLAGSLQGAFAVTIAMRDGKPQIEATGDLLGTRVGVRAPFLADHLKLERVSVPCAFRYGDSRLSVDKLDVQCDFGKATMQGTLDLNRSYLAMLDQPGVDLTLDVNLAALAERLPKTLHLHEELRMTAGALRVACKSAVKDGALVWQGKLHTSDVRGLKGQQMIAWSDPITLEFQVRDLHKGVPLIDHLKCSSRFLNVQAATTPERFTLSADADLGQLAEPLGQFIDLRAVKLAGKAKAVIDIRRLAEDRFELHGNVQLKQVDLTWLPQRPWQEASVSAVFDARGQLDKAGRQRIEAGNFAANLGADLIVVKMTEPIADLAAGPWGAAEVRVNGELARWQQRLRSFTTLLDDWQLAGGANIRTLVRPTATALECTAATIEASNFVCTGSSLWVHEPSLNAQTDIRYDVKSGDIAFAKARVTCPTLRIDSQQATLQAKTLGVRGSASLAGDLARLRQWTQDPKAKPGEPMSGAFAGTLDVKTSDKRLDTALDVTVRDFVYGPPANATWREAEVKCVCRGAYDRAKDAFQVETVSVSAATLTANAEGQIAGVTTTRDLDFTGTLAYDLAKLEPQLRPILGKDVKIVGKDVRAFKVGGALYPKASSPAVATLHFTDLKGEAGLNWKSLKAYGCDVGPAEVKAILQQGWLQVYPIETTINGGKLRLQPNVRLDPEPTELVLLAGPVIEKAQITPAMCAGALQYALPALANVAEAEGTLSLALEGGRIPLSTPSSSELKGTVTLHSAKIGPSPIIRELSGLFRIPPPTSLVKECRVPFTMAQGKVHHRDLELAFPDFTLKSSGTVGLDGSLALIIETSIPVQLAQAAKLTPAQAKQLVRIPVGGTLEQPRLDPRALESLTAILGRSLIENQLNKLLQPKR